MQQLHFSGLLAFWGLEVIDEARESIPSPRRKYNTNIEWCYMFTAALKEMENILCSFKSNSCCDLFTGVKSLTATGPFA